MGKGGAPSPLAKAKVEAKKAVPPPKPVAGAFKVRPIMKHTEFRRFYDRGTSSRQESCRPTRPAPPAAFIALAFLSPGPGSPRVRLLLT